MFSPILQDMLEGELENHLGYEKYEHIGESNINSRMDTVVKQSQHPLGTWN